MSIGMLCDTLTTHERYERPGGFPGPYPHTYTGAALASPSPQSAQLSLSRFRDVLRTRGVRSALFLLNAASHHRFTAVYRFEGETLRNLYLIDREDPLVERCPDLPVMDSYCRYVRHSARVFFTSNAPADRRVDGHPKQRVVRSYCGIPLVDEAGELFGTICHFDFEPVPFTDDEIVLLELTAPLLVQMIRPIPAVEAAMEATER